MKKMFRLFLLITILNSSGCAYQPTLIQGNLLDEDNIDQIEVNMTKNQVLFLLGTPMINDPFHANRWDYVYFVKIGRNNASFKRWISIFFDDDKVATITKDKQLKSDL